MFFPEQTITVLKTSTILEQELRRSCQGMFVIDYHVVFIFYFILYHFFLFILFYFFIVFYSFYFSILFYSLVFRTSFLSSETIIFFYFLFIFFLFYFILFFISFIFFFSFYFLVVFLLSNSFIHQSSSFIMYCGIRTNRKWNYGHVSVLPFIFVSCSLTIEEVGRHSFPLK